MDNCVILSETCCSLMDYLFIHLFFNENYVIQAVPALNGTSFDFVPTENGPVSLDLYSTPQYKRDPHGDCTGELFASPPPN